jgi:uncharacterized protein YndB with AHSA1/START domain
MTTKASEKLSLEIKRLVKASRDRVYAAWTDPAQLKQWFGPENVQTHGFIAEVQVGGKFRWDVTNSDGEKMTCRGEYRELQLGRKIGTELRLIHEQLPNEESCDGHNRGWNSALDKLEKFVSK